MMRLKGKKSLLWAGFVLELVMTCASFLLGLFEVAGLKEGWLFILGADELGIFICAVLYYGCMGSIRAGLEKTGYPFILLIFMNSLVLFLEECTWIMEGISALRFWNLILTVLLFANTVFLIYLFWKYVSATLDLNSKLMRWAESATRIMLIPAQLLTLSNLFFPVYFRIDAQGVYHRAGLYPLSYGYILFVAVLVGLGLIQSDVTRRQKTVAFSFVAIPLIHLVLSKNTLDSFTQYGATLVSIVLMYSVLFSERTQKLTSVQTELQMATHIQETMLPSSFPAFPERSEFDIYASMEPAKEVGGDFYDFFLIDDDHLCMVMADVSGKGVPAALFMMASKIILASCAMLGNSVADILTRTNEAICSNNRNDMFITVWLGILEISTGKLTAANAGHEYPVLRSPGGDFLLLKDKHGLVLGGMENVKYEEYTLQLEPGAKLFLYTDGVPEAADSENRMFGTERMLAALNEAMDAAPRDILKHVRKAVGGFVKDAEQFDDLTMLCMEYKSPGKMLI